MPRKLGPSHRRLLEYLVSQGRVLDDPDGKIRTRVSTDLQMSQGALSLLLGKCQEVGHIEMSATRGRGTTRLALLGSGEVAILNGSYGANGNGASPPARLQEDDEVDLDLEAEDDTPEELAEEEATPARGHRDKMQQAQRDRKIQDLHDTNARLEQRIAQLQRTVSEVPSNVREALAREAVSRRALEGAKSQVVQMQARLDKAAVRIGELEETDRTNKEAMIVLRGKVTRQREAINTAAEALGKAK